MTLQAASREFDRLGIGYARFRKPGKGEPRTPTLLEANRTFFDMTGLEVQTGSKTGEACLRALLDRAEKRESSIFAGVFPARNRPLATRILRDGTEIFEVVVSEVPPRGYEEGENGFTDALYTQFLDNFQGSAYQIVFVDDELYYVKEGNYEDLTGYPKDYFSTEGHYHDLIFDDDREFVMEYDRRLHAEVGFDGNIVYRIVVRDGTVKWVKTFDKHYIDGIGRRVIQGVLFDITDQKRQEMELQDAYETIRGQLERNRDRIVMADRMEGLATLVSVISHEVASPLGNARVLGSGIADQAREFMENFENGDVSRDDLTVFLQSLVDSGRLIDATLVQAASIVKDFKTVAADQARLSVRSVNIGIYLRYLQRIHEPRMKTTPHNILFEIQTERTLETMPGYISQIIQNLLNNALLHAFPDGRAGRISVTARNEGESDVRVVVEDDGCGVPEEFREKMFDMHFTTAEGRGGTGLGLGISRSLAEEKLGGSLTFEQPHGGGARFSLLLRNLSEPSHDPS